MTLNNTANRNVMNFKRNSRNLRILELLKLLLQYIILILKIRFQDIFYVIKSNQHQVYKLLILVQMDGYTVCYFD